MTRTVTSIGAPVMVSRVRRQRCVTEGCSRKTRMALVLPCSDIGEDGGSGLGAVVLCAECVEGALVRLTDAERRER